MADEYGREALAERRRELHKRVQKLAATLEDARKHDELVAKARASRNRQDEAKYPAMASRRR